MVAQSFAVHLSALLSHMSIRFTPSWQFLAGRLHVRQGCIGPACLPGLGVTLQLAPDLGPLACADTAAGAALCQAAILLYNRDSLWPRKA